MPKGRKSTKLKVSKPVKAYVKKQLDRNEEDKDRASIFGTYTAPQDVSTSGAVSVINNMSKGTSREQRVAQQIRMTGMELRGSITAQSSTGVPGQSRLRFIVYLDKDNNGEALPAGTAEYGNLFTINIAATDQGVDNTYNHFNVGPGKRYRILYDKTFDMNVQAAYWDTFLVAPVVYPQVKHFIVRKNWRKRPIQVQYDADNNNDNSDIRKNALRVFMLSDIAPGAGNPTPIVIWTAKILYEDA